MAQNNEKREAPRAPLDVKVHWSVDGAEWHEDRSKDVSSSGMMLLSRVPVASGTVIKMQFNLPNLKFKDPIRSEAAVVRTIQRQGQQVGLGVHFITLRSQSYRTVHEFVCRILGLPLERGMAELGSRDGDGYSFEMEKLAREADKRKQEAVDRKLAQAEAQERRKSVRRWSGRAAKLGLVLLAVFALHRVAVFFMDLASRVHAG